MPWTTKDVDGFIKGLSDKQKGAWVSIANSALSTCMKDGKGESYCAGYAVRVANAKAKSVKENEMREAEWTRDYINTLPDSCFAYIEPGGNKDEDGKTVPRSKRHFPYKDKDGNIDLPHLRNAMARAPQSVFGNKAMPVLKSAAKKMKIGEYSESFKGGEGIWRAITNTVVLKEVKNYQPNEEKREVIIPLLVEGWGNSVDNNYYTAKAVAEAASLLKERRKMYLNHPKESNTERDVRDWAASIQDTWTDIHEIAGDKKTVAWGKVRIHTNDGGRWLWETFKSAPDEIGTSILGQGKARRDKVGDKTGNIIESVERMNSCDFVDYPGNVPLGMAYFVENENGNAGDSHNKSKMEDNEMQISEITLSMLKEGRPELVAQIEQSLVEAQKKQVTDLEAKIKEQEKTVNELKLKLDEKELKEKQVAKQAMIDKALAESKLPDTAKTDTFKEILSKCETEVHVKKLIEDRQAVCGIKESANPVQNNGKAKEETIDEKLQESFNLGILGIEPKKEDKK